MALTGSRLDLVIVPREPDLVLPLSERLPLWEARGWLGPAGAEGWAGQALGSEGYGSWRVESSPRVRLWANEQGGFRVRCPDTAQNLAVPFGQAWESARQGEGARSLACPRCGAEHPLEGLEFLPPAVFAREALVLQDVGRAQLEASALDLLGPVRWIARRVAQRGGRP